MKTSNAISLPDKKYNIIYADPPWSHTSWKNGNRRPGLHYSVMSLDEIKELQVQDITDDNCALFLWVTFPHLKEGLEVMECWGFEYKTVGFTWVKKNKVADSWFFGCGSYTRANAEVCLLGIKGKMKRVSASVHSVLDDRIMGHSEKPNSAREKIVELYGDLPRIELFARQKVEGWDCWGDEI